MCKFLNSVGKPVSSFLTLVRVLGLSLRLLAWIFVHREDEKNISDAIIYKILSCQSDVRTVDEFTMTTKVHIYFIFFNFGLGLVIQSEALSSVIHSQYF